MPNRTKDSLETGNDPVQGNSANVMPTHAVTRRRFLRGSGVAAIGAALGGTGVGFPRTPQGGGSRT